MFFGSEFLDIVIGLIMIYLLLSLLVSSINELIMTYLSKRGKILYTAIRTMLSDNFDPNLHPKKQRKNDLAAKDSEAEDLGVRFYEHPLVIKFARNHTGRGSSEKSKRPSYLNKANFSKILMDLLDAPDTAKRDFQELSDQVRAKMPEGPTRTALLTFIKEADGKVDKLDQLLQQWYEDMMQRASGWYKRYVQRILLILGLVVSVVTDADTFSIADKLANDPEARMQIVQLAENYVKERTKPASQSPSPVGNDTLLNAGNNKQPVASSAGAAGGSNNPITAAGGSNSTSSSGVKPFKEASPAVVDSIQNYIHELVTDELYQAKEILGMGWRLPDWKKFKPAEDIGFLKWFSEGWNNFWGNVGKILHSVWNQLSFQKAVGWFITAMAITLGAPFWFDMLKKVINIRSTGSKPGEGKDSNSGSATQTA